ncbi:MAG: carboxypeptidase regulatory-like domain-containing protein [candidate division Zixibacteria bacterium]|nr:carboxypeptidase regulatory-like domain-containing protein [Candidatus Tariuqbacter arcticus]
MKRMLILVLFGLAVTCRAEMMIGRIQINSTGEIDHLIRMGFSIYHDELEGMVDLVFDEQGYGLLREMGYEPQVLAPLSTVEMDIDPEYHTYEEFTTELQSLAAQYPDLCRLDFIGYATQFPRTIWCMKLSDNAAEEEDELSLFYLGIHHAREPVGGETIIYMINHFLENYGVDPQITDWMNDYEIFFVPLLNPDGHYAVTSSITEFWRKNARDTNHNGIYYEFVGTSMWNTRTEGVDLNRNYDWYWELGGSSNPHRYNYRGTAPFSEDELSGILNLAIEQRFVCGITFHSYGEVVYYPWTFSGQPAPDQDVLDSIAEALASRFIKDSGEPYDYDIVGGQSGHCRNWFYGFAGALAYCVELNPSPLFIPPGWQLGERTERYMRGAIYLLERLAGAGITGHVTDAVTGQPLEARIEIRGRISDQVRHRFAEPEYGRFTRLLNNGAYTVLASMPGYLTEEIENVVVSNTMTELEIQLMPTQADADEALVKSPSNEPKFNVRQTSGQRINFSFELQQPSEIDLKVYDVLGRLAAKLTYGWRDAGRHEVSFDGSRLASGVYFYQIKAGNFTVNGKIALMK